MAIHKIDGVDAVDGGSAINSFPKKFVTLHGVAAIAKGAWVRIDLDSSDASKNGLGASVEESPAATTAGDPLVFGVATEAITAAGLIRIQTAGLYGDGTAGGGALTDGGVNAGDPLCAGRTTPTPRPTCHLLMPRAMPHAPLTPSTTHLAFARRTLHPSGDQ